LIPLDNALAQRAASGHPIRVAMIGAGFMARGIARQLRTTHPGMRLVAISNRTTAKAVAVLERAGFPDIRTVVDVAGLDACIDAGAVAVTDDY
jgi:predicted homoserine dehydrogenase-like protein